ncbi:MAG: hypothetical protein FWG75_01690 [Cystobacterineae bacterium]|nr:hypothetical protein [Cystobacterineae bacterium]
MRPALASFHEELLKEIAVAAEESQKREIVLGVCSAAQRAVENHVRDKTNFKSCVWNAIWKMLPNA